MHASIAVAFFTGNMYGGSQSCAYGTHKLAKKLEPNEVNPLDTPAARDRLRAWAIGVSLLNTATNLWMYGASNDPSTRNVTGAAAVLPLLLLGFYWNDFDANSSHTKLSYSVEKDIQQISLTWSFL